MKSSNIYKHIMSGVSQMIPFVVAGGIMIALAFLLDAGNIGASDYGWGNSVAAWFGDTGKIAFGFMLPILAGFIAYSIADRPGFVPGFVGGALASNGGSGFLGALLIGFIAGYIVLGLKQLFKGLPTSFRGIQPVLLFPLFGTILAALAMLLVNLIVTPINEGLVDFLTGLEGTSAILVGLVAGGMMAVDMGGPINKAAYVVGVGTLAGGVSTTLMAAVMAGGMTPPLGIALATVLFKGKFNEQQIEAGKTNWVMGFSFITEGAIPFAAANPKAVLPSIIAGSALAGALVGLFGVASPAPHGGLFVVPVMSGWVWFIIALAAGTVLTAFLLKLLLPDAVELETEEE
ncbi:MAG: fructose-specific PTS transporter subunit EIIC [Candidatus Izemoplasma sp.]|nr:fructose-specific PTS transporter subunit EIIC [Candidatus Izemoplasma sp.]